MLYDHFKFYAILYLIAKFYIPEKWDIFTRLVSTYNALYCVTSVITVSLSNWWNPQYYPLNHIYYVPSENAVEALYSFAGYLLVDGIFSLYTTSNWSTNDFLMALHHLFGFWGIWTLAELRMGYFLAYYFALTELSTPALNWSWWRRDKTSFQIFFTIFVISRIVTLPWLWNFLSSNSIYLSYHSYLQQFLAYGASSLIAILNLTWTVALAAKMMEF